MVTRRYLLEAAGAGAALAVSGLSLPKLAEAAGVDLSPGVPGDLKDVAAMEALPGKQPLIRTLLSPAELRITVGIFPYANHAERSVLRPLSSLGHSGGRCQELQDRSRW